MAQAGLIAKGYSVTLLNAVEATGAGDHYRLTKDDRGNFPAWWTWTLATTGTPTAVSVTLEGSLDGTTFFTLDTASVVAGEMRHVVNKPVTYIRANLGTLTSGTNPTVTVTLGAF